MKTVLAADLGGTKCRFGLVGADLSVIEARVVPTSQDRATFLAAMDGAFDALRTAAPAAAAAPAAIGIAAAGVVRRGARQLEGAPNLPLHGFPLGEHLERRHGLPVSVLNDGRASAWGEYVRGHARGRDPLLVLFFGTGIGIGLIAGGQPYEGADNAAGEVGHAVWVPDGRTCACGNRGCYEAYCGGGPMTRRAAAELGPAPAGERWTVGDLLRVRAEHPGARAILEDAATAASAMVASLCTLLNPSAVVLGGGVVGAWPDLARRIESFTRAWCTAVVTENLLFVPSLGDAHAVLYGAALATGSL